MLTTELIEQVLATIPQRTVGVLGDLFLDRYLDIDPARNEPSIETGKTAYQVVKVRAYPGAAGTVINNLAALGVGCICPIAAVGDDGEGYELRQALRAIQTVNLRGVIADPTRRTPTYTKPMLGTEELNRLDIKNRTPTPAGTQDALLKLLDEAWPHLDALIVLDQVSEDECGVVTKRVRDRLAELGDRDPAKFVLADSRERIGLFRNVCVKPNGDELAATFRQRSGFATGSPFGHELPGLYRDTNRAVFCTGGELGIYLASPEVVKRFKQSDYIPAIPGDIGTAGTDPKHGFINVPAYPVAGPIDIVGAGDSCSAGITCAMVAGLTHEQAAAFGNLVASITIRQIGVTGTANPEQVRARWREVSGSLGEPRA